jgi:hypothetical protein
MNAALSRGTPNRKLERNREMAKRQTNNSNTGMIRKTDVTKKEQQSGSNRPTAKPAQAIKDAPAATSRSHGGSVQSVAPVRPQKEQTEKAVSLTHDQIAERAKVIWQQRGCPANEDQKNWLDAENQLKTELGVR